MAITSTKDFNLLWDKSSQEIILGNIKSGIVGIRICLGYYRKLLSKNLSLLEKWLQHHLGKVKLIKDNISKKKMENLWKGPAMYGQMSSNIIEQELCWIRKIMQKMGFIEFRPDEQVAKKHNFNYLNIDEKHPSMNEHDSFFLENNMMMNSHVTSSHFSMGLYKKPESKIFLLGRAYRNDADKTHLNAFWQLEWLIKQNTPMEVFLEMVMLFIQLYLNRKIKVKVRPSYFPFTYMSYEIDIEMDGKIYEVAGAGMMHPRVLKRGGETNPSTRHWPALAFGVERLIMIKYHIKDIKSTRTKITWN